MEYKTMIFTKWRQKYHQWLYDQANAYYNALPQAVEAPTLLPEVKIVISALEYMRHDVVHNPPISTLSYDLEVLIDLLYKSAR
jgi:hypothetical protein